MRIVSPLAALLFLAPLSRSQTRDTVYTVPEVVVTATREGGTRMEVPLAVSLISPTAFSGGRGFGLDAALRHIPGVLAQSRSGGTDVRLTIRGFGARGAGERSNAGTSRGIRLLLDGFPETEPDGRTAFDLVDLDAVRRIEVVRSNATAVWGNASGGVLNIVTLTPDDPPGAEVRATFGSFGLRKQTVRGAGALDGGRVAAALSHTSSDGWRDHSQAERTSFTAGLSSRPGERTRLDLSLVAAVNAFRIPGPLTPAQFWANPRQAQDDPAVYSPTYVQRDERRVIRLGRLGAAVVHDLDGANSLSVTAFATPKFLQRSERNTFRDFTRYHLGGGILYRNLSAFEEGARNIVQAGVDGALQDGAILFYRLVDGGRGPLKTDKREGAFAFGAFATDEVIVGDQVSVTLGARYDRVTYDYALYYDADPKVKQLSERKTFAHLTPKFGATFRVTPAWSVYANLGGGLEVPAGNETDPPPVSGADTVFAVNPLLEASRSVTAELGTKQVLALAERGFLRSLSYDAALYYIRVTNDFVPYRGGRFYLTVGETERMGVELGGSATVAGGFTLTGALTLSRNRYLDYPVDSVYVGGGAPSVNYAGNAVAGVPPVFYSGALRYEAPWGGGIYAELALRGTTRYFADDGNRYAVPPYAVWDARVAAGPVGLGGPLVLFATVALENFGDRTYAASAWVNPDVTASGEPVYLEPGLPRNFAVSLALALPL